MEEKKPKLESTFTPSSAYKKFVVMVRLQIAQLSLFAILGMLWAFFSFSAQGVAWIVLAYSKAKAIPVRVSKLEEHQIQVDHDRNEWKQRYLNELGEIKADLKVMRRNDELIIEMLKRR